MGKPKPFQAGISRWLTGWLALCLLLLINFKTAAITTALWLVEHDHDHQIAVQADGNHFDVRLSHDHDHGQPAADHGHESSLGLIASLFSTHDHDGADHVLHFNLNETPDQIRQRSAIIAAPTPATTIAITAINSICPRLTSTKLATAIPPESPPPLTTRLLGLRTTVLLI